MNKNILSFLLLGVLLFGAFSFNTQVQSSLVGVLNALKINYLDLKQTLQETIEEHFFQASTIHKLHLELQEYKKNQLLLQQLASEINKLYTLSHSPLKNNPEVALVRAISYQEFGNKNRLWIEFADFNTSKVYGLTAKDGLVAGIAVAYDNKPLALLNNDIKSTYAVFVGDEHAPGIAHGNNGVDIVVNFIPAWFSIKVGDEVSTSGLDNLFFKGLKVGKVLQVTSTQGYKSALVRPYYQENDPRYFYLIKRVK
jgi:rod shape-determining protein MreC